MLEEARTYALDRELAERVSCPLLVTSPQNEQFWPAQSELLAGLVGDNATVVDFSAPRARATTARPSPRRCAASGSSTGSTGSWRRR
jgi:hypothetical protein